MSFKNLILCAANKYVVIKPSGEVETIVIPDSGHFCNNMQSITRLLRELGCNLSADSNEEDRGQGFINQNGEYLNRSEAYKIAKSSGQPFNDEYTLPNNKLDSSCIRHFDDSKRLKDYMEG